MAICLRSPGSVLYRIECYHNLRRAGPDEKDKANCIIEQEMEVLPDGVGGGGCVG